MPISTAARRFLRSEDGTIALIWSSALIVFIGFLALVFDVGRLGATQSELQSFADHVALTSAAELDGTADAIDRATAAAANLISDTETFGDGDGVLSGALDYTLTFHSALPESDATPMGADATNDPRLARIVEVNVTPRALSMSFALAVERMLGTADDADTGTATVGATAVAGFSIQACDINPLMFCLPSDWEDTLDIGDLILLRSGGKSAAWGPGDFGFIDLDLFDDPNGVCADEGGNKLACLIAAQEGITACVNTDGTIELEPGQKVGITNAALNVRFDIFRSVLNGEKNNPDFAPAPNVIKGIKPKGGGACIQGNEELTGDTMGLPRDTCMPNCGRFGDGVWDRQAYLNANHDLDGDPATPATDAHLPVLTGDDAVFASTRYGMYLREIAYANSNPHSDTGNGPYSILDPDLSENGRPQCSSQMSNDPLRRVVVAAGVDCAANPIGGAASGIPVERYLAMFLTEPVGDDAGSPPSFDIHGEFLGFADSSGTEESAFGGIFRDVVQLYR